MASRTQAQRAHALEVRQEPRAISCLDGVVLVTPYGDRPAEVEDVAPEDVPRTLDGCQLVGQVSLTRKEVRACYEGQALTRAHATARLTPLHRAEVFGPQAGPTYECGRIYYKIGRTITDHCPYHPASQKDCTACAEHRTTCAALKDAPIGVLNMAYKFADPVDQRNAVLFVQTARKRILRTKT